MAGPTQGEVYDGYRYMGGDPKSEASWQQAAPVDVSAEWGPGARRLPNGSIERVGPRGGVTVIGSAPGADDAGVGKLTEAQGKAVNFGMMMRGGERDYQAARAAGYNPASVRNQVADFADMIPWDGGALPRLIRDDISDQGRQAETRWTEANLRQLSGAAVTPGEVTRTAAINFDRANDELAEQRYRTRAESYAGTRFTAGPGAAALGEYPAAGGPGVGPMKDGLPTYPGISALAAGISDGGPGTSQPGGDPRAPGGSPENPFQIVGASREETVAALRRGGWFKNAEGQPYQLPGAEPEFGVEQGDQMVGAGVAVRPQSPDQTVENRRDESGLLRRLDAGVRGAADTLTFGFADEIAAGANTVLPLDPGSRAGWQDGFGSAFRHNLDTQRAIDRADIKDVPVSRGAGQIAGGAAGLIGAAPRAAVAVARPLAAQIGRGAVAGGAYGGAYGFGSGQGNAIERLPSAGVGAAIGAATGGVLPVGINALSRVATPVAGAATDAARAVARPVVNALGTRAPAVARDFVQPNALARGLDRFAGNNRPNVNALSARSVQLEQDIGRAVPLIDTVNSGGRGVMRGAALRSDDARQVAEDFALGRVEALPSRMGQQARRIVSDDARTPDQLREALTERRSGLARTEYAEPYSIPVAVDGDLAVQLSGAPGRSAIQRARAAAEAWNDTAAMQELDALGEAAANGVALPEISAGTLDRVRQAMSGRGEQLAQKPGTRAVGAGLQNRAGRVDAALDNVEGLDDARATYRDLSRQIEAVDSGEAFLSGNPDEVIASMQGASPEVQAAYRAAAARSIERASGTTGAAPGVANRLAVPGTPQRQVMDATLGEADASRLAAAARGERDLVRNANRANPGQGSNTNMDQVDTARAAGSLMRGRPFTAAAEFVMDKVRGRGFSPAEAEAFLRAAQDSSQTAALIDGLARRMNRREARNLARTITYQVTRALQSDPQG